ncbi:Uncharacterised protein [Vibrio cholerae]|uniref:Uncharacterized protein n=1 Tax=Vibrio cholerae TaxID=666 RepID=A0A655Z585_VIBCL|nr:Uncharacterised protein [Vibrio cholerae]
MPHQFNTIGNRIDLMTAGRQLSAELPHQRRLHLQFCRAISPRSPQ